MARGISIQSRQRQQMIAQDKAIKAELRLVAEKYADINRAKHEAVTRDWQHRPYFKSLVYVSKRRILSDTTVTGKNAKYYLWTDRGTKPHDIVAKNVPYLRFQIGYSARTAPIAKFGVGTGRKFGAWRSKKIVHHPGTKARKFSETFSQEDLPDMRKDIENAIKRGLRRAKG